MEVKVLDKKGMQHVRQVGASCGLASAVMALQPWTNPRVNATFEAIMNAYSLGTRLRRWLNKNSTRYQLAAALALLHAIRDVEFMEYLASRDDFYNAICAVAKAEAGARIRPNKTIWKKEPKPHWKGDTAPIKPAIINDYARSMKTNVELSLLMAIFGRYLIPWDGCKDGTGAVVMNRDVEVGDAQGFFIKHFDQSAILFNGGFHWVAVKRLVHDGTTLLSVSCKDPAFFHGREVEMHPCKRGGRFYFFREDASLVKRSKGFLGLHFPHDGAGEPQDGSCT
ncbi:hypothetical protein GF325_08505 [Candidatus Bathyarchaeota archaeon]|nr:hypothetical protein [Candidatus Bathyarchaeota archaeon]